MASWVIFGGIVSGVGLVTFLTLRSLKRWRQPPPGTGAIADHAELILEWMTRSQGDQS